MNHRWRGALALSSFCVCASRFHRNHSRESQSLPGSPYIEPSWVLHSSSTMLWYSPSSLKTGSTLSLPAVKACVTHNKEKGLWLPLVHT